MKITEEQLRMLSDYYNAYVPFLDKKEVYVGVNGIKVVAITPVLYPDENQYMPEEVWQPLELWHEKHRLLGLQIEQCLASGDLPF
jgi:hypothetical protein